MEEDLINKFEKYVKTFDLSNNMITRKHRHTLRVTQYAKDIAKSENLNGHDYHLAFICALLHDIGRFKQAEIYHSFEDLKTIDHGDLGYQVLLENDYISQYVTDDSDKQIVLSSVKYHNKFSIPSSLTDKEIYFTNLVRDADKLDILDTQKNTVTDNKTKIEELAINNIKEHKLFKRTTAIGNDVSEIVNKITFIFDFNFKRSFEIVKNNNSIKKKFDLLYKHCDKTIVEEIEKEVFTYIDKKIT